VRRQNGSAVNTGTGSAASVQLETFGSGIVVIIVVVVVDVIIFKGSCRNFEARWVVARLRRMAKT
jgi:hypothetical protein